MTRPRKWPLRLVIIFLVLGLLGILIPMNERIWRSLAYETVELEDPDDFGLTYEGKRFSWLPGKPAVIPDQQCPPCKADRHNFCGGDDACKIGAGVSSWILDADAKKTRRGKEIDATHEAFIEYICNCEHRNNEK